MSSTKQPSSFTFRPGKPEEYETVLDIQRRAYRLKEAPLYGEDLPPFKETPETIVREEEEGKKLYVGVHEGRVVGSMRIKPLEDGWIYWGRLSVDPDLQGQGLGQAMVRAVEDAFPDADGYVLDCGERSEENFHIYSKMGYRKTGEGFQVPGGPYVHVMKKPRGTE